MPDSRILAVDLKGTAGLILAKPPSPGGSAKRGAPARSRRRAQTTHGIAPAVLSRFAGISLEKSRPPVDDFIKKAPSMDGRVSRVGSQVLPLKMQKRKE
jgi:hypothetical protein